MDEISIASGFPGCGPILPSSGGEAKPLRLQIFEFVRGAGAASRADIARSLRISPGSVTAITSDLIAAGLLREVEGAARDAARGRPPVALEVSSDAYRVLGVKFADDRHTAVLTDFSGAQLAEASGQSKGSLLDVADILDETGALIEKVLGRAGLSLSDIAAVGIGMPGVVNHETGVVAWSPILRGRDVPLRQAFENRFGVPTLIDNDSNLLALAELWFGAGRDMNDFAVVTIEHGVGMGLVLNNRLFRGAQGLGLELGHTKVQLDGALCRCGQRGCLEAYVADYALVREASIALGRDPRNPQSPKAMLDSLFDQAKAGNQAAQTIFKRAGRYLSVGLANVVQLFDPNLIILSGERMRYDYLYADEVLSEMRALTLHSQEIRTRVEIHAWGDLVWARGAAALALSAVTERVMVRE